MSHTVNRREFLTGIAKSATVLFLSPLTYLDAITQHEQPLRNEQAVQTGWQHFGRVVPEALQTFLEPDELAPSFPVYDVFDRVSAVYPRRSLVRYDLVPGKPDWGCILGERSRFDPNLQTWSHIQPENTSFVVGSFFRLSDLEPWHNDSELTVLSDTAPGAKSIEVDLRPGNFHLRLFEYDDDNQAKLVLQTLIAGNPDLTPEGDWPITAKQFVDTMIGVSRASETGYNHYSVEMSMQFTSKGEKIHGSAFMEVDRFPEAWLRGNIRREVRSNGCVRVPVYSAAEFVAWQQHQDSKDGVLGENQGEQEDYFWGVPEFWRQYSHVPLPEFIFRWTRPHVGIGEALEGRALSFNNPEESALLRDPRQVTFVRVIR